MNRQRTMGLILGILGLVGIVISFVIGFSPWTQALPALFGVILIGVALVMLKA